MLKSHALCDDLSIFDHYLSEFNSFPCSTLIVDEHPKHREGILKMLKVNRFVGKHLDNETRTRYLPVHVNAKGF